MTEVDYTKLEERLGEEQLARRQKLQKSHCMRLCSASTFRLSLRAIHTLQRTIRLVLRVAGLYHSGRRNALDLQVEGNELFFTELPSAFDGYRILHISDLHIDSNPDLPGILQERIRQLTYDLCLFTGDYREEAAGNFETAVHQMIELFNSLESPAYAVLGNHDEIEMVPLLEEGGFKMLLNEQTTIEHNGEVLYLIGVDDPYHYKTDHLEKAAEGIPENGFRILLAHSPEIAPQAAEAGIHLYLCGHTHGGQICLPGGRPLVVNSRCRKPQRKGIWKHGNMIGYTSRGAGTSSAPVRFNCPPEITVHTLRRME